METTKPISEGGKENTTFEVDGIQQFGDASLFDESNIHLVSTIVQQPANMVKPGDLVYTPDPARRFKFFLFDDNGDDASRTEHERLRSRGYFKVGKDLFHSATRRFETTKENGGFFGFGRSTWFACPIEEWRERKAQLKASVADVAGAHAQELDSFGASQGIETFSTVATNEVRGQRR